MNKHDINIVKGTKGSSGYDTYVGGGQSRWVNIGGATLRGVPDKLYFGNHGDVIIAAYNKNNFIIMSFWNVTKNEGNPTTILNLIFHPYIWLTAIIGACFLLGFKKEIYNDTTFKFYSFLIYGSVMLIIFIYSLIDWSMDKLASKKVEEFKNNL